MEFSLRPSKNSTVNTIELSKVAKAALGEIGIERFQEFSRYAQGWKDGFSVGEPLSFDSWQTMEHFLAKFKPVGKFPPSLFFSITGNLQLAWKTQQGEMIELEFLAFGIEALLPDNDDAQFFSNEKIEDLIKNFETVD
jgi:hypothetical protein